MQSFGLRDLTADATCIKNRLRDARSERPNFGRAFEKIRELAAFKAEQPRQADVWKVRRLGHADISVGRDEVLLRLADVRPAF